MKKFQFPLEAALRLRERAVEAAELALRATQGEWNAKQREREALVGEVREAALAVRGDGVAVDPEDFVALDKFRVAADKRLARLAHEATAIGKRLAERQAALQLAERDQKLVERLKEKARDRWEEEFDKEQQQMAEEAYLSRWGR